MGKSSSAGRPSDNAVFDMDIPSAATGAIHAVRTADNLIVLPPVPVELFPLSTLRIDFVSNPSDRVLNNTHECAFVERDD